MSAQVYKRWHKLSRGEFFIGYRYNLWRRVVPDEDLRWSEYATDWRIQIGLGKWIYDIQIVKYDNENLD